MEYITQIRDTLVPWNYGRRSDTQHTRTLELGLASCGHDVRGVVGAASVGRHGGRCMWDWEL